MFNRASWLRRSISAAQLGVSASGAIAITKHVEDRHAPAKMLSGGCRIGLRQCELAMQSLHLAGEIHVSVGIRGLLGGLLELRGTFSQLSAGEMCLRHDQMQFANRLAVADSLRNRERLLALG